MDRWYLGFDIRTGKTDEGCHEQNNGGLTDLLNVIGHFEEEIKIGAYAQTYQTLSPFFERDVLSRPLLSFKHYFEIIDCPERKVLDAAQGIFIPSLNEAESFLTGFRDRVNRAIQEDFPEEVTHTVRVKRKLRHKFEPEWRTFSDWMKTHLETTGELPSWDILSGTQAGKRIRAQQPTTLAEPKSDAPSFMRILRKDGTRTRWENVLASYAGMHRRKHKNEPLIQLRRLDSQIVKEICKLHKENYSKATITRRICTPKNLREYAARKHLTD